mmetsp:Transcript_72448/g.172690  ORF Transcript_72448/g.172690 Transcript_72448/m.172690 type:complete len:243 (+) Transcript_72448:135-863(+)
MSSDCSMPSAAVAVEVAEPRCLGTVATEGSCLLTRRLGANWKAIDAKIARATPATRSIETSRVSNPKAPAKSKMKAVNNCEAKKRVVNEAAPIAGTPMTLHVTRHAPSTPPRNIHGSPVWICTDLPAKATSAVHINTKIITPPANDTNTARNGVRTCFCMLPLMAACTGNMAPAIADAKQYSTNSQTSPSISAPAAVRAAPTKVQKSAAILRADGRRIGKPRNPIASHMQLLNSCPVMTQSW